MINHADGESGSIDFAWYLMIWIVYFKQSEDVFWKKMTPARCISLYKSFSNTHFKKNNTKENIKSNSLSQYLMSGGI